MKFLRLEILNLASLDNKEGEVIEFEKGALGDCNIFSIVGPTGSGKSTLLDAICLALYNRAPRYPRQAGEKKAYTVFGENNGGNRLSPTDGRNILSHGRKDGYSKVTFMANSGEVYRAEWHVHLKRTNYDNATTLLFKIKHEGDTFVEEECQWKDLPQIIGLDYDQFLKTVLIAQGSFANFINSSEEDRFVLLEKLIGNEATYTAIADAIGKQHSDAVERLNSLNSDNAALAKQTMANDELDAVTQRIEELTKLKKEAASKLQELGTDIEWFKTDSTMASDQTKLDSELEAATQALQAIDTGAARLRLHDALADAIDMQKEKTRLENEIAKATEEIEEGTKEYDKQQKLMDDDKEELTKLKTTETAAIEELAKQKPIIEEAKTLKTQILSARTPLNEKEVKKQTAKQELDEAQKKLDKNAQDIEQAQKDVDTLNKKLTTLTTAIGEKKKAMEIAQEKATSDLANEQEKMKGKDAKSLQEAHNKALSNLNDWDKAIEVARKLRDNEKEAKDLGQQEQQLKVRNEEIGKLLGQLTIAQLEEDRKSLHTTITLMTSEQWELHRASLEDEKPCPLCGAVHHPYTGSNVELSETVANLKKQLDEKDNELAKQKDKEKDLIGERSENEGKAKTIGERLNKLKSEKTLGKGEMEKLKAKFATLPEPLEQLEAERSKLQDAYGNAKADLDTYNDWTKRIEDLNKAKDEAMRAKANYDQEASSQEQEIKDALTAANTTLATAQGLTQNLTEQRKAKQQEKETADEQFQKAQGEMEGLKDKFKTLMGDVDPDKKEKELEQAKEDAHKAWEDLDKKVQEAKQAQEKRSGVLKEKRDDLATDKEKLGTKEQELTQWIATYNGTDARLKEIAASDVAEMATAADDWDTIRQDLAAKTNALTAAKTLADENRAKRQKHQESKPKRTLEEAQNEKAQIENAQQPNDEELIEKTSRKQKHDEATQAMGEMAGQLAEAAQTKQDWDEIHEAIGGNAGKTLRKVAQCYTLRFLVAHANEEMRKFNSRYELQQVENSLEIRVIDHDRADSVRDTTSLSGGETFIVSLGLALGLSSLSSKNVSFENLFIDEGFGTLDPDTLATVIDSLSMLQSQNGKKVGVISHTDTMSERITTQIRIVKNGNSGSSHIEVHP